MRVYQFRKILEMDLRNLFTNPMWLVYSIGLPFLLALIMGFLLQGSYGRAVTAYDYYGVTMMVFGALNTATVAANSFMEDRIVKANMRLCNGPVPAFSIHFTKVIAAFLFGVFCHTITGLALYLLAGVNFGGTFVWGLWILMLLLEFFAACLAVMFCCLLKNEEAVNQILSNVITVLFLLGGGFFPLRGMGRIAAGISGFSPVTWVHSAAFRLIYDGSLTLLWGICGGLILLSAMCTAVSTAKFRIEDYL